MPLRLTRAMSACAAGFLALGAAAYAEPAPPVQVEALTLDDGALAGPGAAILKARLASSQFILFGEDHGFADSPQLALAIAQAARPFGFKYHVVEVGPLSEEWASAILRKEGLAGLAAALDGRPLALPFLGMREDAELAEYFLSNAARGENAIWGVDQEFVGSPLIHLKRLTELAKTPQARTLAGSLLATERTAFSKGRQNELFVFSAKDETFAALKEAFADDPEARKIITALEESAAIYQLYGEGKNYASNTRRVALLRQQFIAQYGAAPEKAPRVFFKMGSNHLTRGTTLLNTFDLGSLTEGVAAENGLGVLRILFVPLEGKATHVSLSADKPFVTEDYRSDEIASLLAMLAIDEDDIAAGSWSLIALEPVRQALGQKGLNSLSGELRSFVLGFDYLLTTRGARAARPLAR